MSTYRVPKCGRHFVKFDDVNIYPVLVVARTGNVQTERNLTSKYPSAFSAILHAMIEFFHLLLLIRRVLMLYKFRFLNTFSFNIL